MASQLTVGSLFAGIGGFDLGLERAGMEIRFQVEIDPFCRAVLEKHWPQVKRYEDVRTVGAELERVDVLCGGFPCQDISFAGSGDGLDGERSGLWHEMRRLVGLLGPRIVVVENVAALTSRGLGRVLSDLWPASGSMRNGRIYSRAPWVRHTHDDGCSLWPTPTASMDGRGFGIPLHERSGRYKRSTVLRVQELVTSHGWRIHPHFTEALMGFPIGWSAIEVSATPSVPTARNGSAGASSKRKRQ